MKIRGKVKSFIKITLVALFIAFISSVCHATQTKIIVAPVSLQTVNSSSGIYPDISYTAANDIINELNKNLLFDVPDIQSSENLIMSLGLWSEYRKFLGNYKDKGVIDYNFCTRLKKKSGIDKVIFVSSGFSMQSMVIKQSLLYKLGLTEVNPINSYYRLDVQIKLIDTQSGLEEYSKSYDKDFKVKNFEAPSNSLNDNVLSSRKIRKFSKKIATQTAQAVLVQNYYSPYKNINSDVIMPSGRNLPAYSTDGANKTRDGRPLSPGSIGRENSFKNWVKEGVSF